MMEIKIKKLHPKAVIPQKAHPTDAGFDLTAVDHWPSKLNDKCFIYKTGLAFEIPPGHVMLIFPRSSIYKVDTMQANSVAVIDSGYRGEVSVILTKNDYGAPYRNGERIAQAVIIPYPEINFIEAEELSESDRGTGAFGSTGK